MHRAFASDTKTSLSLSRKSGHTLKTYRKPNEQSAVVILTHKDPMTWLTLGVKDAAAYLQLHEHTVQARAKAGIRDFTWHGLRHTWATWHIMAGTPVEVLQKLGGWADIRMVLKYTHMDPGYLAQWANNARPRAVTQNVTRTG